MQNMLKMVVWQKNETKKAYDNNNNNNNKKGRKTAAQKKTQVQNGTVQVIHTLHNSAPFKSFL